MGNAKIALSAYGTLREQDYNSLGSYGLGLAIVKMLLDAHETELIINSIEGKGTTVKMICSGGDKLFVRRNNVDEKEVISQTTLILCANDIAKFDPPDVYEKLIPFSLKTKFVSEEITPKLLKANPYYKQADDNIESLFQDEEIIDAITSLIFNSYKPTKVKNNEDMKIILETFTDDVDIVKLLLDNFEITGNTKHKVYNDAMKSFLKEKNINISFSKVVNIFNTKGVKYADRRVEDSDLKKRCFIGIVQMVQNNNDNINNDPYADD